MRPDFPCGLGNLPPSAALSAHEGQCPKVFETLKALHNPREGLFLWPIQNSVVRLKLR
jgi:hypothetical protein